MLGHRDIRTTIKFYAGMEGAAAARHYEAVLQDLLDAPAAGPARPRRGADEPARLARAAAPLPAARGLAGRRPAGWLAATARGDLLLDDGPGAGLGR